MAAPAFRIIRGVLEMTEQAAAEVLNLDRDIYIQKEQGDDSFAWEEIVTLYNFLTPKILLLPIPQQRKIQVLIEQEHFPDDLKVSDGFLERLADLPKNITSTNRVNLPVQFVELPDSDPVIDSSGNVNTEIADKLKSAPFFSKYRTHAFTALVWWHNELGCWAVEMHQVGAYRETLLGEHLDEIVEVMQYRYL